MKLDDDGVLYLSERLLELTIHDYRKAYAKVNNKQLSETVRRYAVIEVIRIRNDLKSDLITTILDIIHMTPEEVVRLVEGEQGVEEFKTNPYTVCNKKYG